MIPDQDREVLTDVARVAAREGLAPVVVGAGARLLLLDWEHDLIGGRTTTDWDIAVRVESWDEFNRFKAALLGFDGDMFRRTSLDHRIVHRSGRSVDIIPYGGIESPRGAITWPNDKRRLLVEPLSRCSKLCKRLSLGSDLSILVVTVPSLALLKAFAYFERREDGEVRGHLHNSRQGPHVRLAVPQRRVRLGVLAEQRSLWDQSCERIDEHDIWQHWWAEFGSNAERTGPSDPRTHFVPADWRWGGFSRSSSSPLRGRSRTLTP